MSGPLFFDRVMEESTITGTGPYTLDGIEPGFQTFAIVGDGNTCYYCAYELDAAGNPAGAWEVGSGTYTAAGTVLSRDAILASSNAGAAVSWSGNHKRVSLVVPASRVTAPIITTFADALHGHLNAAGGGTLAEAALALTDITTNNVSTAMHGFMKKLPNDAGQLFWGNGAYAAIGLSVNNPSNPTATTSTTNVMMGLGATAVYTPAQSGRLLIFAACNAQNSASGSGINVQIRSGTGSAPANGASDTGTARGAQKFFTAPVNNGVTELVMFGGFTTTVGVQVWVDLAVRAITGGTATLSNCSLLFLEL